MAHDAGGARPEQFGARQPTSEDASASLRTPVFLPSEQSRQVYHIGATTGLVRPTVPVVNLQQPSMEPGFHEEMGTIARQLRQYTQHVGAAQIMREEASIETPPVSEAAAFNRELTKERAISNDLQCEIFDEKRAHEHLKGKLTLLQEVLKNQLQEAQVTLKSLHGDLKVAHTTNAELALK